MGVGLGLGVNDDVMCIYITHKPHACAHTQVMSQDGTEKIYSKEFETPPGSFSKECS